MIHSGVEYFMAKKLGQSLAGPKYIWLFESVVTLAMITQGVS